jgi:hypothetical protein
VETVGAVLGGDGAWGNGCGDQPPRIRARVTSPWRFAPAVHDGSGRTCSASAPRRRRPSGTTCGLAKKVEGDRRLPRFGAVVDTPRYGAPEQARCPQHGVGRLLPGSGPLRAADGPPAVMGRDDVRHAPPATGCRWVDDCDRGGDGFEFLDSEHAGGVVGRHRMAGWGCRCRRRIGGSCSGFPRSNSAHNCPRQGLRLEKVPCSCRSRQAHVPCRE